ncbi:hypothetical protein TruAng_004173 [Truncatella angustata]|nr:hypothetical protein TruAng_004173 [Truncatella angustata]
MPSLPGFSANPFITRSDFITGAAALLKPLDRYKSSEKARIKIATASGAGFSETAAQLEGFARPLWVVADLLRQRFQGDQLLLGHDGLHLESWIAGLKAGTDPCSIEYWGDLVDFDQRMVEMESIALALLSAPSIFGFSNDEAARNNLRIWLLQINSHKMPVNNWRWFRIFVNLALIKCLGVPYEILQGQIGVDLAVLDSFYLGDGWSSDGLWGDERKQADYYSGSFAIQFAQLLFIKYAADYDSTRTGMYKQQAREFAIQYWRYFDEEGAAIPFGRSLTYRFAFAAFWSAVALADIQLPEPLDQIGVVKGLLLRHVRWWAKQEGIFNTDGTLNIGYTYPNMYMSEDYNSPQSVYWCLKSFVALGIPAGHPFWTSEEAAYPAQLQNLPMVKLIWPAKQIICNTSEHHFLLSSGQSSRKDHRAREAKYSKFAYSSAFAFSVPVGVLLEQIAPDSVLSASQDGGESWQTRWEPYNVRREVLRYGTEEIPTLVSSWKPWRKQDIIVETHLIPPIKRWPGWHLRVHTIRHVHHIANSFDIEQLVFVDSGFAISAQMTDGQSIFDKAPIKDFSARGCLQGCWQNDGSSLIISEAGASGVMDLTKDFLDIQGNARKPAIKCRSKVLRPNANTNLVAQRTLIPSTYHTICACKPNDHQEGEGLFTIVTGVFAVEVKKTKASDMWELWQRPPMGQFDVVSRSLKLRH